MHRSQAAGSHGKCAKCGNSLQAFQAAWNHELRRDFKTPKTNSTFLLLDSGSFHSKHSPTGWSHFMNVGLLGSVQSLATIFLRLKHTHTIWHTCSLSFALKKSISHSGVTSCGSHTPLSRAALFYSCWHSSLEPKTFSLVQVWRRAYYVGCFDEVLLYLQGFPSDSDGKESACNAGDLGSIPGSERFPGKGNGNPVQCSCLENSMDRGAWGAQLNN